MFECGKMQTAHHILHDSTKFKPPCHIYEVDNLLFYSISLLNQRSDQHLVYTK